MNEIHRFPNGPVRVGNHIHWDILRLWSEIQNSLRIASQSVGDSLVGMGLDTWGVDFGLLDSSDKLIGNPYHYRDARTNGMIEAVCQILPREEIYNQTGIQFMQLNTLFQLFAMRQGNDPALQSAKTLLTTPDLFNFWLTGRKASELTISTTTQCYNPREKCWASKLLAALEIPQSIFQPIIQPGTVLDDLCASIAEETSCKSIPVIAVGSHDTASAVAAVPAEKNDFIYISSGTWSLMGVESEQPIINANSLHYDLTNEGGVYDTILFQRNIMGMWLLQESRRQWAKSGKNYSYEELTNLAGKAPALKSLISVGDNRFLAPADMVGCVQSFCRETGQSIPQTVGEIVRCILESLALEYRWGAEKLCELSGRDLLIIHIIGGGSRNQLLNQFTADAASREVVAGPVEATAIGNILIQAIALGQLSSLSEGRALVRRSFDMTTYQPKNRSPWDEAYSRYLALRK
jgi:rhamnulokinase